MPFPIIRRLDCKLQRLFDKNEPNKDLKYFNPSSAYPYLYIRATKRDETSDIDLETNHMFIYDYTTDTIREIEIPYHLLSPTCAVYRGIEDTRLVMFQNRLWFVASSTHISSSMQSEILIGYFNQAVDKIEYIQHLNFHTKPIKNTCPFVYQNKLCLIDTYTFNIYEVVDDKSTIPYTLKLMKTLKPCRKLNYYTMRGSTSPINLHGNLWGCITHEHIANAKTRNALAYISYWMEFDIECGIVTFISSPFYVTLWGIEFISGIEYFRDKDQIELYLGIQDKIAVTAYTNLYKLRYSEYEINPLSVTDTDQSSDQEKYYDTDAYSISNLFPYFTSNENSFSKIQIC